VANLPDDQRTVTITVATLKAYEAAVHKRESARLHRARMSDALDAARLAYERATLDESNAIDAEIAATQALHGTEQST
jgi:hypothetical protein